MKPPRPIAIFPLWFSLVSGAVLADDLFPPPRHRVMLLGTFHFVDAGLDDFKPEFDVDIMSDPRQHELTQVLAILETYQPTRIAVEVPPAGQAKLDDQYEQYLEGRFELPAGEIYQLGFRLARRSGHRRVYAIDADRRFYLPYVDPEAYALAHGQQAVVESPWYALYEQMARAEDELKTQMSIGQFLLQLNQPERIRQSHGIYLVGTFKAGRGEDYPGVDAKTAWYNRNLRIFNNIQRITGDTDERILVIIGSGHLPILRHCVETSPEYELVEPSPLLERQLRSPVPPFDGQALLRMHTYELEHEGRLGGPGLEFLVRETANAQFVLLGEPHNTDQVNRFTRMLFETLHETHGFDHLVTEQDALIMDRLTSPGIRGRVDAVRSEARKYPRSLHFSTDEELSLLAAIGRVSDAEHPLWGVDRVHDAALALEALVDASESPHDRQRIKTVLRQIRQSEGGHFIGDQATAFDDLISSLEFENGSRAEQILHAIRVSREHFLAYQTKHEPGDPWSFLANELREELMKTRLMENYRRSVASGGSAMPRAVAKLGHWHIERGHGPGGVPTLGSFLVDAARFNGMDALSISIQPVNEPGRHWSITDHREFAVLTSMADPSRWRLVDLRPLRGYIHSGALEVSSEAERTVFGFDLLLLLGGTDRGKATWGD